MGDVNQNIRVRVDAMLNGMPIFQQFGALLEKIRSNSAAKIEVGDAASIQKTSQFASAVDNLGKKIDELKPSKLQELSTLVQGLAAGSTFLKNLGVGFESVSKGISYLRDKGGELVEAIGARAQPLIQGISSAASGLAAELPAVAEGAGVAAVGIGGVAVAAGAAVLTIGAIVAAFAAAIAITTALAAALPALVTWLASLGLRVAETDAATGKLQDRLKGGEIQGIIQEFKTRIADLSDQLGRALVPAILEVLRVALHIVDELRPSLGPFFSWVITQIGNIANGLARLINRAIAAGKAIGAAIAIGYATGSPIEAGKAAIATYNDTVAELDKAGQTPASFAGAEGGAGPGAKGSGGGGGGGGGGGSRPPKPEDTSQSRFAIYRAEAEAQFKQISEALDRENQLVTEKYNDRKLSISDYYDEVYRIEADKLQAEANKLSREMDAVERQLTQALQKIDEDRASGAIKTDAEAEAKRINERNRATERSVQLNADINSLRAKRAALPHDIEIKEKADTDALNESLQRQIDAMDRLRGLGPLVDARNAIAEIDKLIEEFADNPGMQALLEEWREVVGAIGQAQAAASRFDEQQKSIELQISVLRERGNKNILERIRSEQQIRALRQQELEGLKQVLKLQEDIARHSSGPGKQKAEDEVNKTRQRIEELKNSTKGLKETIKDTFIDSAGGALENFFASIGDIITGIQTLGQAFRQMGLSIIKDLEAIIAKMIVMKILEAALGVFGGGGTSGSVHGGAGAIGDLFGGSHATGDYFPAHPGGRIIRVAEGGHDEVVLTTDPRHRNRTQSLLASFLQRTKLFDGFDLGGWVSAITNPHFAIPGYDVGGWAAAAAGNQLAGTTFNMGGVHFHGVKDAQSFRQNQAAIERDLSRAARRGMDRSRKG